MEIGPVKDSKLAVGEDQKRRDESQQSEKPGRASDDVKISTESRARLETGQTEEVTNDRLDQIRERIDSGFYEQTQVKDKTIDKLMDEMLENINQFYR